MNLGPPKLSPAPHRYILKQRIYKRVLLQYRRGALDWGSKPLAELKGRIRHALRVQQKGRCVYCRRLILIERRNACEDIEHFLDKSKLKYRGWSFSPVNLSLACHACNVVKTTRDMLLGKLGSNYPNISGTFRWLHPYYDDYHANIEIGKGWTYQVSATAPSPVPAQRMINECGLDQIEEIHKYAEAIKTKMYRLTCLAARVALTNPKRAKKLILASQKLQEECWPDY